MQTLQKSIFVSLIVTITLSTALSATSVFAQTSPQQETQCRGDQVELSIPIAGEECVTGSRDNLSEIIIITYMRWLLRFAAVGLGLVITVMISIGGVQYILAQDNPQAIQAAKKKILNAIISLVLFILAFAILNYLVPGGLISA